MGEIFKSREILEITCMVICIVVIIKLCIFKPTKKPFIEGTKKLKPSTRYMSGEHRYIYRTDKLGRIVKVKARKLKFAEPKSSWNKDTPEKRKKDHSGHLIGNRFGGSNDLDNLVSMKETVNLTTFKCIENRCAKAMKQHKRVSMKIKLKYNGKSRRPAYFKVKYRINGKKEHQLIKN